MFEGPVLGQSSIERNKKMHLSHCQQPDLYYGTPDEPSLSSNLRLFPDHTEFILVG
jgi:hypothetical protein